MKLLQANGGMRADWLAAVLLAALTALLFLGAPSHGEFSWSDAPRHALNGVFVKDFVAAMPWQDPAGFAYRYYAQYPALTILFYPPLFYVVSAPFYALFGFSHPVALLVMGLHYVAFALAAYCLTRRYLTVLSAGLLTATIVLLPELTFWGRQIMLEIPALAFLLWSVVCFLAYQDKRQPRLLYWAAILLILAMYTKITAGFMALVYLAVLIRMHGFALWRQRFLLFTAVLSALALIPLIVLTIKFGQANVTSLTGIADAEVSRTSLAGWLWYARQLPAQMGWGAVLASLFGSILLYWRRASLAKHRADVLFLLSWFVLGYLFFSAIDLKEARHSVFILPPVLLLAGIGLNTLSSRFQVMLLLLLAAVTLWQTLQRPVHYVAGYDEAASVIAKLAPENSAVLFSGYRDGAFVFNMRTHEERRDITTVRADKLLLKIAVRRELGVEQKSYSEAEIVRLIDEAGVRYVVAQRDFWIDLEVMKRLQTVLDSNHFEEVSRIALAANYPASDKVLVVYRNKGAVERAVPAMKIDLPIINQSIPAR
jgi:4-amino-4-deoxy-L-arabinose transferase-like glycosyltransferase